VSFAVDAGNVEDFDRESTIGVRSRGRRTGTFAFRMFAGRRSFCFRTAVLTLGLVVIRRAEGTAQERFTSAC